ncbi:MAG TPA: hypothetical protein PKY87_13075 [Terricaulis sp.]|nr:hypothetical protein [Terricaulis sp.]
MTISFQHHPELELNRIAYSGLLSIEEMLEHATFRGAHLQWLNFDHINVVLPGTDTRHVTPAAMDDLFAKHQALFLTQTLLIRRRSAWVCQSPAARGTLDYWLGDRTAKPRAMTDVRLFDTLDAAADWLLLRGREKALAVAGEGFEDIAHFCAPPLAA